MRITRRASSTLTALLGLAACGGEAPADSTAQAPGRLVIVGGALQADNADVYEAILAAREGDGPLCVLPTAGSDPAESIEEASETLATYAGDLPIQGIPLSTEDPSQAEDPSVAADITSCSGFYFTGGSQSRVLDVFLPDGDTTAAYRALWERWRNGAVLAGSSAGAAMMSRVMINGGGSDEAVASGVAEDEDADGVEIRGGMGFFPWAMVDQHFLARGRIGRLLVASLATDSLPLGLGIDENTALVVDGDRAWVVGASAVVVVDAREATLTGPFQGTGIKVSLAGPGDALDLATLQVTRSEAKEAVPASGAALQPPEDPFARWAFLQLVVGLASTPATQASFDVGGVTLTVSEADGFSAVMTGWEGGVEGAPAGFAAGPFTVELQTPGL